MTLIIIALVCSQLGVPDHRNCMVDTAARYQKLEVVANSDQNCEFNGMTYAAARMRVDARFEYVKVMCVRPSVEVNRMPG